MALNEVPPPHQSFGEVISIVHPNSHHTSASLVCSLACNRRRVAFNKFNFLMSTICGNPAPEGGTLVTCSNIAVKIAVASASLII